MWFFYSALQSVLGLKRKCGKCGRTQIVPVSFREKAAKCRYCGGRLPAPGPIAKGESDEHPNAD